MSTGTETFFILRTLMLHIPSLYIADTESKGRGVFISEDIETDNLIEICPLIVIPKSDVDKIHQTILHDYYFIYQEEDGSICMPLGYGCLYNHSARPNARVAYDFESQQIHIISTRKINAGDEILIDYRAGEDRELWFEEK